MNLGQRFISFDLVDDNQTKDPDKSLGNWIESSDGLSLSLFFAESVRLLKFVHRKYLILLYKQITHHLYQDMYQLIKLIRIPIYHRQ